MAIQIKQSEKQLLPAGRYPATLTKLLEGKAKKYQSEEEQEVLYFIFSIPTEKGIHEVRKRVTPTNNKKGNLYKFACELHPDGLIPEDVRSDTNKFSKLVESFVGGRYLITLAVNGEWNNIMGASPFNPAINNNAPISNTTDEMPF